MKWQADQRAGFFGWDVPTRKGVAPQPRVFGRVDIDEAMAAVGDIIEAWRRCVAWPEAAPFSGGVLDSWPARMADGLAVCRAEFEAVMAYHRHEEARRHG